ncbi:metal-dependent transcriptional regulator [Corynebacterium epidermidicanis]|uniref:Diphtheria toxin repressor n=1 Tax=Corynebacterium epidermidicanis TaxID=1050174 RepID=A0A0G3GS85_9CORY|nr:metal-dependent transcriptional regulator [Corynebacterium epidermidicanis]AKK02413.1 iron (metal) dependent repressor, DtxR family [Corynebacterium epidermidicanis]
MDVATLPAKTQDYLKIIFDIVERTGQAATMGELAAAMKQRPSTTTEGVKRLAEKGLVHHERYTGITLTEAGRGIATAMARRHRLIETFLVAQLGYSWDEVHAEADLLEHAVSDLFIARIDELLGHPTRDPHGDPIPLANGEVEEISVTPLQQLPDGASALIERVHDSNADLLRYLAEKGIRPGVVVQAVGTEFAGMRLISVAGSNIALAAEALEVIDVSYSPPTNPS